MKALLLELMNGKLPVGETLTQEHVDAAVEAVEASGKLIPEAKFLEVKKANTSLTTDLAETKKQLETIQTTGADDAAKLKEELDKIKAEQETKAEEAKVAEAAATKAKLNESVKASLIEQLKGKNAISANLSADDIIKRAEQAGVNFQLDSEGKLITDLSAQITSHMEDNQSAFSTTQTTGGAEQNLNQVPESWTKENAMQHLNSLSDQDAIDLARTDKDFAVNTGMEAYHTE